MNARSQMLDQALALGRRELDCLVEGDVFGAEKLANERDRILDEAMEGLSRGNLETLGDKLVEMKELHDKISGKAKELHASLKKDLAGIRQQNKRMAGYSYGAGNMPRLAKQRFLSKKS